jgi:hypothetical protein
VSNDAEVAVYASADMVLKAVDDLCVTQQEKEKWIEVTDDVWKVFQVDGEGIGGPKGESSSDQRGSQPRRGLLLHHSTNASSLA